MSTLQKGSAGCALLTKLCAWLRFSARRTSPLQSHQRRPDPQEGHFAGTRRGSGRSTTKRGSGVVKSTEGSRPGAAANPPQDESGSSGSSRTEAFPSWLSG